MEDSWHAQIYYTITIGTKHLILHVYVCYSVQTPVQNIALFTCKGLHHCTKNALLYPVCTAIHPVHIKVHKSQLYYIHITVHNPLYNIPTYTYTVVHNDCNSFCTRDCAQPRNLTTNHILQSLLLILCYIPTLTVSHFSSHGLSIAETSTTVLSTRQANTFEQIPKQTT